ncbi:MAG: chromate transporter [Elusimicrobiota bacterium]|jgi:chromate transporter|nr:chromate transporter [Elusimicrobiota bacterium]
MTENEISLAGLFAAFIKIGAMTFGGGIAMLPIIERELTQKKHLISIKELMDFYSIAQATPGVIALNVATLVGYKKRGFKGALAATLGLVLPSFVVIVLIAAFLNAFMGADIIARIFAALRICVAALVINAVIPFFKRGIKNTFTLLLFILTFCAFYFFKISPAFIVAFCAMAYILFALRKGEIK